MPSFHWPPGDDRWVVMPTDCFTDDGPVLFDFHSEGEYHGWLAGQPTQPLPLQQPKVSVPSAVPLPAGSMSWDTKNDRIPVEHRDYLAAMQDEKHAIALYTVLANALPDLPAMPQPVPRPYYDEEHAQICLSVKSADGENTFTFVAETLPLLAELAESDNVPDDGRVVILKGRQTIHFDDERGEYYLLPTDVEESEESTAAALAELDEMFESVGRDAPHATALPIDDNVSSTVDQEPAVAREAPAPIEVDLTAADEASVPAGQSERAVESALDIGPVPTEAEEKRHAGRPPGRTVYAVRAEFFDSLERGWDRAKTKRNSRPSCKAVSAALDALASEGADVIRMAPDTILRGIRHHMGPRATWDSYVLERALGQREPQ